MVATRRRTCCIHDLNIKSWVLHRCCLFDGGNVIPTAPQGYFDNSTSLPTQCKPAQFRWHALRGGGEGDPCYDRHAPSMYATQAHFLTTPPKPSTLNLKHQQEAGKRGRETLCGTQSAGFRCREGACWVASEFLLGVRVQGPGFRV